MALHPEIAAVTDRVIERSKEKRAAYLAMIARELESGNDRPKLGCANLAHAYAGTDEQRDKLTAGNRMNIGIVTAYNDMLSAHAVFYRYPEQMKIWALEAGATAQVAGGVPAMCDGVTQGYQGMELSLFSRDAIAMGTAIALSHRTFEGAALLGICDKIVPGLLMGALRFGHLPMVLVPGGPMRSGLPNKEKAAVREAYAEGKVGRDELLEAEIAAYHSKGTCTFYGTANSNQMMMEAMGTAIALSHRTFEGAALLGICDKIVPGLLMGALRFGHLPMVLVPGGPMRSGLPNKEKAAVREAYAEGKVGRDELLEAEIAAYHSKGTCTFYGTANSNQMMMEAMGLHVPGAAFANPGTKLRQELTKHAVQRLTEIGWNGNDYRGLGHIIDEKAIVNAAIALLATGGSTNHLIHVPAIARAAGIVIDWEDFDRLSRTVPLLTRVYPNGSADVNGFEDAGGPAFVIRELLAGGLMHADVATIAADGMAAYGRKPAIEDDRLVWPELPAKSGDESIIRTLDAPFSPEGGFRILAGNLGRACIKVSAVERDRWTIEAPCRVFATQQEVQDAFKAGELDRDVVVVVRFQGPKANGMPELHKLTPPLGVLQNKGFRVALVTDGRMSGASGKVPAAIHLSPEALGGGPIGKLRDGDVVRLCAEEGVLSALVDPAEWAAREQCEAPPPAEGTGRELFAMMRLGADEAELGASAMLAAAGL